MLAAAKFDKLPTFPEKPLKEKSFSLIWCHIEIFPRLNSWIIWRKNKIIPKASKIIIEKCWLSKNTIFFDQRPHLIKSIFAFWGGAAGIQEKTRYIRLWTNKRTKDIHHAFFGIIFTCTAEKQLYLLGSLWHVTLRLSSPKV